MHRLVGDGSLQIVGKRGRDEIIFLRGLGTRAEHYAETLELLAQNYTVLVTSVSRMQGKSPQPTSIDEYIENGWENSAHNISLNHDLHWDTVSAHTSSFATQFPTNER